METGKNRRFGAPPPTRRPTSIPSPSSRHGCRARLGDRRYPSRPGGPSFHGRRAGQGRLRPAQVPPRNITPISCCWSSTRSPGTRTTNGKAYIGMDLSSIAGMEVADARLSLTFAPTGWVTPPRCPTRRSRLRPDRRNPRQLGRGNHPLEQCTANEPGGVDLDTGEGRAAGVLRDRQGELSGTRSIEGRPSPDFLNRDANGMATFISLRENPGERPQRPRSTASPTRITPSSRRRHLRLVVTPRGR